MENLFIKKDAITKYVYSYINLKNLKSKTGIIFRSSFFNFLFK